MRTSLTSVVQDADATSPTVVIPSLGRDTLERAVMSVERQSVRPRELIVVINGNAPIAADRCRELERLARPVPLQVHSLPPFSGPSICRNVGAWAASSAYVAFLDDDDEYSPGYLAAISDAIASHAPDLVYGAIVRLNPDGSVQAEGRLNRVPREQWLENLFRQQNHGFGGTNLVIKKAVLFELGGFPVDLLSGEDRALAMAAIRAGLKIEYVDEAEVICHDAVGARASGRPDKWLVNLKLIDEYWADVPWPSRLKSTYRVVRALFRRSRKGGGTGAQGSWRRVNR